MVCEERRVRCGIIAWRRNIIQSANLRATKAAFADLIVSACRRRFGPSDVVAKIGDIALTACRFGRTYRSGALRGTRRIVADLPPFTLSSGPRTRLTRQQPIAERTRRIPLRTLGGDTFTRDAFGAFCTGFFNLAHPIERAALKCLVIVAPTTT